MPSGGAGIPSRQHCRERPLRKPKLRIRISIAHRERQSHVPCRVEIRAGPRGGVGPPLGCRDTRAYRSGAIRPLAKETPGSFVGGEGSRTPMRNASVPRTCGFSILLSFRRLETTGYPPPTSPNICNEILRTRESTPDQNRCAQTSPGLKLWTDYAQRVSTSMSPIPTCE